MVSLTRRAAERIRNDKDGKRYLRVITKDKSERSILYNLNYTNDVNSDDILYMSYGIKILVDNKTRKFFENLEIDYRGNNGHSNFVFVCQDSLAFDL